MNKSSASLFFHFFFLTTSMCTEAEVMWKISPPARMVGVACCSKMVEVGTLGSVVETWVGRGKPSPSG